MPWGNSGFSIDVFNGGRIYGKGRRTRVLKSHMAEIKTLIHSNLFNTRLAFEYRFLHFQNISEILEPEVGIVLSHFLRTVPGYPLENRVRNLRPTEAVEEMPPRVKSDIPVFSFFRSNSDSFK